jgi:Ca2+-binding RTX toxin-like protein
LGSADTLLGDDGDDVLAGGAGDDLLFGTSQDLTAAPDLEADVLDGGAGFDQLFLGAQETGTSGEGADQFISRGGVTGL